MNRSCQPRIGKRFEPLHRSAFLLAPNDTPRLQPIPNIKNHGFVRDSVVTHMRDEYSTFGWVIERMLTDVGFTLVSADYHAPLHGTYLLRKPKPGEPG
jgi:hypothetical protein